MKLKIKNLDLGQVITNIMFMISPIHAEVLYTLQNIIISVYSYYNQPQPKIIDVHVHEQERIMKEGKERGEGE